jgi:hypothetical protein
MIIDPLMFLKLLGADMQSTGRPFQRRFEMRGSLKKFSARQINLRQTGPTEKMIGLRIRSSVLDCVEKRNVLMNDLVKEVEENGGVRR